jgi:LPXTG-motif cell wall-anchored protein
VIVAQAGPTTTVGHGATLPVTGGSDGGLLTAAVVAGGLGIVATLVVRRSSRA